VSSISAFGKAWELGVLLVLAFAVLGELIVAFDDYVFYRLGMDRNLLLLVLWSAPLLASCIASYYSERLKLLAGLSFHVVFPVMKTVAHYVNGELGGAVDFVGPSGALIAFKVYLGVGSILVIVGTAIGLAFSRRNLHDPVD